MEERLNLPLLALEMEGAMSLGMQTALGSWKRQENRFFPKGSRKESIPADTLILAS